MSAFNAPDPLHRPTMSVGASPQGGLPMLTLLDLLSAVALLIWGTHIVRTGILRVYGAQLRRLLGQNISRRPLAFMAGILVTARNSRKAGTACAMPTPPPTYSIGFCD